MKQIMVFFAEVRQEFNKVTWPSWEDVNRSTAIVFVTVIIFTVFVYLADLGLNNVVKWVLSK